MHVSADKFISDCENHIHLVLIQLNWQTSSLPTKSAQQDMLVIHYEPDVANAVKFFALLNPPLLLSILWLTQEGWALAYLCIAVDRSTPAPILHLMWWKHQEDASLLWVAAHSPVHSLSLAVCPSDAHNCTIARLQSSLTHVCQACETVWGVKGVLFLI